MTVNQYAVSAQQRIAELSLSLAGLVINGTSDQNILDELVELIDFQESILNPLNPWTDDEKNTWIEWMNIRFTLNPPTYSEPSIYTLPVVITETTTGGPSSADIEAVRTQLLAITSALGIRITDLENFDYSSLIPSTLISDVATAKSSSAANATTLATLSTLLNTVQSALNSHINDTTKHITSTDRTRWNQRITASDLSTALANYAALVHTHELGDITGLIAILNDLQDQITSLPAPVPGTDGVTPNIQIGTIEAGSSPDVSLDPTSTVANPILNFILQKGDKGDKFYPDHISNNFSDRSAFDSDPIGISFLDSTAGLIYFLLDSPYSGGITRWSTGMPFGANGWTPVLTLFLSSTNNIYIQVSDFTGGSGPKPWPDSFDPTTQTLFIGISGYTVHENNAINIRGIQGFQGNDGPRFTIDDHGTDRTIYDAQLKGFVFLDDTDGTVSWKLSDTAGDWSASFQWKGIDFTLNSFTGTATGTDTYAVSFTSALPAYVSGQVYFVKFPNTNTGPSTLNIDGNGVLNIYKNVTTPVAAGDIPSGKILALSYDGTNLQIIGGVGSSLGYTAENVGNKDIDGTLAANSDTKYPSQKAVKTYVDALSGVTYGSRVANTFYSGPSSGANASPAFRAIVDADIPNAVVINKTLVGYTSGAGVISSSDTVISAIQKLNGNIAAITIPVTSVFGRVGAVVATSGDYTTAQVTESGNLYHTNARTIASTLTGYTSGSGVISSSDTILSAVQKLNGNIAALTTAQISESGNLYFTNTRAISSTLTGYVSGSGLVSSSDTVLSAIQKLNGNIGLLTGSIIYQGTWNASTNTPTLVNGTGTKGFLYKVSVAGTTSIDGISQWNVGDQIVFDGTTWDKIDGIATEVLSVFGRVGAVVGSAADYSGVAMTGITSLNGLVITANTGVVTTGTWQGTAVADTYIASSANWNTAYTNLISSLTVTGNSGAATLSSNVLNIPTYTIAGLGGYSLANGGTLTGANTLNSTIANTISYSLTGTTTANNQTAFTYTGTPTLRGTASDAYNFLSLTPTFTLGANTQVPTALNINSTLVISGGLLTGGFNGGITGTGMTPGTYNSVAPTTSTSGGTGALVTIVVTSATTGSITAVTTPGSGYLIGSSITFANSLFGGSGTSSVGVTSSSTVSSNGSAVAINVSGYGFGGGVGNSIYDWIKLKYAGTEKWAIGLRQGGNTVIYDGVGSSYMTFGASTALTINASSLTVNNATTLSSTLAVTGASTLTGLLTSTTGVTSTGGVSNTTQGFGYKHTGNLRMDAVGDNSVGGGYSASTIFNSGTIRGAGSLVGGTAYVNGTYTNVPVTGGSGSGAQFTSITVAGGIVTVATIAVTGTAAGSGYLVGDVLSASNANLGGSGSGFSVTITSVGPLNSIVVATNYSSAITINSSNASLGGFYGNPTYNLTNQFNGKTFGFWWNPTMTSNTGSRYGILVSSGLDLNGFGTATPTATVQINGASSITTLKTVGAGTGTNYSVQHFQSDGITNIWSLQDNGQVVHNGAWTATANNQSHLLINPTLTSRATVSDVITGLYSSTSIEAKSTLIDAVGTSIELISVQTGGITDQQYYITTNTAAGMTATTYTTISPASTSGSGTGALFTIVVSNATTFSSITVTTAGSGYKTGDTITFNGSQFGSGSGSKVYVITAVNGVSFATTSSSLRVINKRPIMNATNRFIDFQDASGSIGSIGFSYTSTGAYNGMSLSDFNGSIIATNSTTITIGRAVNLASSISSSSGYAATAFAFSGSWTAGVQSSISSSSSQFFHSGALAANNQNSAGNNAFAQSYTTVFTAVTGFLTTLGSLVGGSGYSNGTFSSTAATGGSGTGATLNITVAGNTVTVCTIQTRGANYRVGDVLSASLAGGSGFTITVTAVNQTGNIISGYVYAGAQTSTSSNYSFYGFYGRPTFNLTNDFNGKIAGIYWDPIITANTGTSYSFVSTHVASLGGVGIATPIATWHIAGSSGFKTFVSSAASLTLDKTATTWVFSGTTTTWTLPVLTGNTDLTYIIFNRGSGVLTLTRAGSDNLYTTTSVTTISIAAGEKYIIQDDGAFWLAMKMT